MAIVQLLVGKGAPINAARDSDGATALHLAAGGGHLDVIYCLVDGRANVRAKDKAGAIPLHLAASKGYQMVVEYLVNKGADIKARNARREPPVDCAEANGHLEVADCLERMVIAMTRRHLEGR